MTFVVRMVWRETRASWLRLGFFFLCVGLGVASIVALRSVAQHVRRALTQEARGLIGADLVLQSQRAYGDDVRRTIDGLAQSPGVVETTDVVNTQTMVTPVEGAGNGQVKLVELRGVEAAFPFYGRIELENGHPYSHSLLTNHGLLVAPELLVALDVQVGDQLRVAGQPFTIRGIVTRDRTQGNGGIAFGPRAYIDLDTLRATALLGFGSRASYQTLFKFSPDIDLSPITDAWREQLRPSLVSVRSWQTLEDRIGRNLTTAEDYLSLVGFAIVVLGGLGVWSVTRVIVQQKVRSVAILKCLGASSRQVLAVYVLLVLVLATGGSLLGIGLAWAVLAALPASYLTPLGVEHVSPTLSAVAQGWAVGVVVSLLFGLVPLLDIQRVKPLLLLRAHSAASSRRRTWQGWALGGILGGILAGIAVWQAGSFTTGLVVSVSLSAIAVLLYAASTALLNLARPLVGSRRFAVRHATVSLRRPGNQTRVILMAVGLGCFFIVGVRATQQILLRELSTQVGEQSPDLVLIDIQPDQVDGVIDVVRPFLRHDARIAPLMRGRVTAVSGRNLTLRNVEEVQQRRGLGREFGLTFRDGLEPNERLVEGEAWGTTDDGDGGSPARGTTAQSDATDVTVERELFDSVGLSLGDVVQFDIAGQNIRARITGVRSVDWEDSQNGGFVFVLRPSPVVELAPHTFVGFLQVRDDPAQRGQLQRALVRSHPNVSVIDVREVLASIRAVVDNVTLGITVVGAVTLIGGVLILAGAVAMTKFQRLYETAIYRTLGASARLVATMLTVEYGVLGLLAGAMGTLGGVTLSWALARYLFDIAWRFPAAVAVQGVAGTAAAVVVVGTLASADILWRKPLATLRSE